MARQLCDGRNPVGVYMPGGGNGAGPGMHDLGGVPGVCGDPFQSMTDIVTKLADEPCSVQATYAPGSEMTVTVELSNQHGGYFEFAICPMATGLTEECFKQNTLMTESGSTEYWAQPTPMSGSISVENREVYDVKVQLPPGLTCEHCTVMWTWWTSHTCTYDCDPAVCGAYAGFNNPMPTGGSGPACPSRFPSKGEIPQMFRACGDIAILDGGVATGGADTGADAAEPVEEMPTHTPTDTTEDMDMGMDMDMATPEEPVDDMMDMGTTEPVATPTPMTPAEGCASIADLVSGDADLATLGVALEAAMLTGVLADSEAVLTVLAPVNSAFAAFPKEDLDALLANADALTEILNLHVVPGAVKAADLSGLSEASTLGGAVLNVSTASGVMFTAPDGGSSATVTTPDLMSCGGVVHKIDAVLIPGVPGVEETPTAAAPVMDFEEEDSDGMMAGGDDSMPPADTGMMDDGDDGMMDDGDDAGDDSGDDAGMQKPHNPPPAPSGGGDRINCGGLGNAACTSGAPCDDPWVPVQGGASTICRRDFSNRGLLRRLLK